MQRRRFLAVAGTGATVGVAGCGDQGPAIGGDESDGENGDEENESADGTSGNETGDSQVASNETEASNDTEDGTDANTDESDDETGSDGDGEATSEDGDGGDEDRDDRGGDDQSGDDETGDDDSEDDEEETDDNESDDGESEDTEDDDGGAGDDDDNQGGNGDEDDDDEEETHTLAVTVTDATMEDVPLEATVEVDGQVRSTTDGEVEYELPNGTYDVTTEPSSEAYQAGTETVAIDGDDVELRIGLVPTSADLTITDHSLEELEGITAEGNGYVAQGTVANRGTADSEEVYVEVALYDGDGARVTEGFSSSFTVAANEEEDFGFAAMHEYQTGYDDVDLERYDVRVLTFEGNHVLAETEVGSDESAASLSTVRTLLS